MSCTFCCGCAPENNACLSHGLRQVIVLGEDDLVELLLANHKENSTERRKADCWAFFELAYSGGQLYSRCLVCARSGGEKGVYKCVFYHWFALEF